MSNKIRHYAIDTEFNGFFGGLISMALVDLYTNNEASSNSSEVLHNALTDARSIRDSVLRLKGFK